MAVPISTPQTSRHLAMKQLGFYDGSQGYGQGQESAAFRALTPQQQAQITQMSSMGGAPALQEPLHQFEKDALTGLSNTSGLDQGAMSDALAQMKTLLGNINSPVTMEQVTSAANPYAQGLKDNLSRDAEKLRAQITANQGQRGGRSFGDTSTGNRLGQVDAEMLSRGNEIDYQTWMDALTQKNTERQLAGTSGLSGITNMFNMGSGLREAGVNDLTNKLGAGQYIRGFNQDQNNIMLGDIANSNAYPTMNLQNVLGLLGNFQSGGSYYHPEKQSTASRIGDYASLAAGFFA